MAVDLVRRMADNQIRMASESIIRDAARLADAAGRYADDVRDGKGHSGDAFRLSQDIADILRQASRLDGMNDIAALLPGANEEI